MGTVALGLNNANLTLGSGNRRHEVLRDVSLAVDAGELVTVVGPSGSGKSTLLAVLAGLLPLDTGTLDLGAQNHGHHPGIVFQDPLLLPWLDVGQNVSLGLRYRRHGGGIGHRARARRSVRTNEILAELGIAELADRYPSELSGGQAQRVAIARTIVVRPAALLLDEPFGALDPRTRRDLQDWLLELRHQFDLSIVLVTHDVDEALYLGDRVAVLSESSHALELIDTTTDNRATLRHGAARTDLLERLGVPIAAGV